MRRIATAIGVVACVFGLLPAGASAAFGPAGSFNGAGNNSGQFNHPQAAVATASNVYVADTGGNRVGSYNSAGVFQGNLAGSPTSPSDVAINSDGSLVAAVGSGQVARWLLGAPLGVFGVPTTSYGIAIDGSGTIYVSDTQAGVINKYNNLGQFQGAIGSGQLAQPRGLTTGPDGSIYVADSGNSRIVKLSSGGNLQQVWQMPSYTVNTAGGSFSGVIHPQDVAVDSSGRVFAPDSGVHSNLVAVFDASGNLQQLFGAPDSDPNNACKVVSPWGVATSPSGTVYVVSTGESLVRMFDESHSTCPTPDFGSGGGIIGSGGGGGSRGTAGAIGNNKPQIGFTGFPRKKKKCVRRNFNFQIHLYDESRISRMVLLVNHHRVATQTPNEQFWNVKVHMPVRALRRALPHGSKFRILVVVKAVDFTGLRSKAKHAFRVCA